MEVEHQLRVLGERKVFFFNTRWHVLTSLGPLETPSSKESKASTLVDFKI